MTTHEPSEIVSKIDAMVAPAPEPENAVLTDETRVVRWTGPLFALFSLILLPWTIYLAGSLPAEQVSTNYDAAWAGAGNRGGVRKGGGAVRSSAPRGEVAAASRRVSAGSCHS